MVITPGVVKDLPEIEHFAQIIILHNIEEIIFVLLNLKCG